MVNKIGSKSQTESKNWSERHPILTIFLGLVIAYFGFRLIVSGAGDSANPQPSYQYPTYVQSQEQIKQCNPNWDCGSWSDCDASGIQKRNCIDSKDCKKNSGKPSETQTCNYQYKLKDRVVVDDVAYTINSRTESNEVGKHYGYGEYESFMGETADGIFYIFDITLENVGVESKTFFGSNIKIYDNQGRTFDHDTTAEIYIGDHFSYNQLQPSLPKRGKMVFDVPKGLKGKLEISSTEFLSDEKKYVSWD